MKMLLIYISLFMAPIYGLPQNAFADCSPENGTTSPVSEAAAAPLFASSQVAGQILATDPPAPTTPKKSALDLTKEFATDVLHSGSVAMGGAWMQKEAPSIWWQPGEENHFGLTQPMAEVQLSLKARSIPGLDNLKDGFLSNVVNRTKFNVTYTRYCLLDCRSEAQATSSGYSNPTLKANPTFEWSGKGYNHGISATIQEELPFNLIGKHVPFYAFAGANDYKNEFRMDIHTATCSPGQIKIGITCPKIGNEVVYDHDGSFIGEVAGIGVHLNDNAALEFKAASVGDSGWAAYWYDYPPSWRNDAYSLAVKFGFK